MLQASSRLLCRCHRRNATDSEMLAWNPGSPLAKEKGQGGIRAPWPWHPRPIAPYSRCDVDRIPRSPWAKKTVTQGENYPNPSSHLCPWHRSAVSARDWQFPKVAVGSHSATSLAPVWLQFDSSLAPVWLPRFARATLGTWRLWRTLHSIKDGHGKRARWDPPTSDPRVRPCCPTSSYLIRSWQSHGAGSSAVPSCGMGGASISFAGWRDVAESTAPGRAGWELESGCLASSPSGPSDYGERSSSLGLE